MEFIKKALLWVAGTLFFIAGFALIGESYLSTISLILAGLFLIPASTDFFYKKTDIVIKPKVKFFIIAALVIASPIFINQENKARQNAIAAEQTKKQEELEMQAINATKKQFFADKDAIIRTLKEEFENKNYETVLSESEKYMITGNPEIIDLYKNARSAIASIQNEKKTAEILEKLKTLPTKELHTNKLLYQQLVSMHPQNEKYKEKLAFYTDKVSQRNNELAAAAQQQEKAALRKERIAAQFHPWDGSHIKLEKLIKNAMNDPESYEHVDSGYIDNSDSIIVQTTYRGRNAFGGVVKNFVRAKVNLDGDILEIIDES